MLPLFDEHKKMGQYLYFIAVQLVHKVSFMCIRAVDLIIPMVMHCITLA